MQHTSELLHHLTARYLADDISVSGKNTLFSIISKGTCIPELEQIVAGIWKQPLADEEDTALGEQIFEGITAHRKKVRQLKIRRWMTAAAAVLLPAAISAMFLFSGNQKTPPSLLRGQAMLTLGDQSQISLSSNGHQVIHQGGTTIVQQGGQLTYTANNAVSGALTYNTLKTAAGAQFNLVLPDGTRIWINAGSSVTYPAIFPDNKRQIEVKGEVYMEVQPDKRPFWVSTQHQTVQVLGTAFNLQAYSEEPFTFTTLVSGKIRIVNNYQTAVTLRPGQQAIVNHQSAATTIPVNHAAIEQAIAWKNGYFDFENKKLEDIFRLLSRWYDVQFEADPNTRNLQFSAVIARSSSLEEVLSVLAATGAVNFSRKGNTIRVTASIQHNKIGV